jgi:hypothetical protein
MGFFSGSKTISVSSVVYNLAGDEDKRPNYLKTAVSSGILTPERTMGETLTTAYLKGPGIVLRNFERWGRSSGYTAAVGQLASSLFFTANIDYTTLAPLMPHSGGETVGIQSTDLGVPDYSYWVDRYMLIHHPDLLDTDFTTDFNPTTKLVTITLVGGAVETFTASDYYLGNNYLYVRYALQVAGVWGNPKVFIYQQGSGNTSLDAFFTASTDAGSFFPYIPVRVDNAFVSGSYLSDVYPLAKKALKKSINGDFDELVAKIQTNPSLADIDFAFVVFGVSLNVKENACRRYIYEFFQEIMLGQDLGATDFHAWKVGYLAAVAEDTTWKTWGEAQADPMNPLYGTPEPPRPVYTAPPQYVVQVLSARADVPYHIALLWSGIEETVGSGLKTVDAKAGDLWFDIAGTDDITESAYLTENGTVDYTGSTIDHIKLNWQVDADTWRTLDIYGLVHRNLVYGGKTVDTTSIQALQSVNESGFIVPLHEGVYRRIPLTHSTQMSTACCFVVFNCYKVVETRWYQTGFFQILIVIILIVIAVVVTVLTGGAATPGILGTAGAVGSAMGFAGTAAIIAGAIANAIAAMVLVQIITRVSTAILGDKIGTIVGTIASVIAVNVSTSIMSGISLTTSFSNLLTAENLLKATAAIGDFVATMEKSNVQDTLQKTQDVVTDYTKQSEDIQEKFDALIGSSGQLEGLTVLNSSLNSVIETADSFLGRTLMTGSDIAGLSLDMLSNFADITLKTDLPI